MHGVLPVNVYGEVSFHARECAMSAKYTEDLFLAFTSFIYLLNATSLRSIIYPRTETAPLYSLFNFLLIYSDQYYTIYYRLSQNICITKVLFYQVAIGG